MLTELNHGRSGPKRVEAYRMTSFVHLILVAIVVTILGVAEAPNASAHAFLLRSAPADGSTLAHAPSSMTLTFDEDVLLQAGSLTLRSANGSVLLRTGLPGGSSAISGKAGPELVVGLPDLGKGTYSATWSIRSADDLHQTTGTVLGAGMGEASSGEEKYKWRKAYQDEFDTTPVNMRRIKKGK